MNIHYMIERFLRETDMPPTLFGRLAARDPRLVLDMRMGREVRPPMTERLVRFMKDHRTGNGHPPPDTMAEVRRA